MNRLNKLLFWGSTSSARWPLLAAWFCLVCLVPRPLRAQSAALLAVEPDEVAAEVGETFELAVRVQDAIDLYGVELRLTYDPAIMQVIDVDDGQSGVQAIPGAFLDISQGFLVVNQADNELGELVYVVTLLAPAEPLNGNGTLLEVSFRGVGEGISSVELESSILASTDGQVLPMLIEAGQVMVGNVRLPAAGTPKATAVSASATLVGAEPQATATEAISQSTITTTPRLTTESAAVGTAPVTTAESPPSPGQSGSRPLVSEAATTEAAGSEPAPTVGEPAGELTAGLSDDQIGPVTDVASTDDELAENDEPLPDPVAGPVNETKPEATPINAENNVWGTGVAVLSFVIIAGVVFFGRRFLARRG